MHTVDFPTRTQNVHYSAIDNIFINKYKLQSYKIFPLSNTLFDDESQYIVQNIFFFLKPKLRMPNIKKCKVRLILSETVSYFQ